MYQSQEYLASSLRSLSISPPADKSHPVLHCTFFKASSSRICGNGRTGSICFSRSFGFEQKDGAGGQPTRGAVTSQRESSKNKTVSKSKSKKKSKEKTTSWNEMSHLCIKRVHDDDLTPGARRDREAHPYVALAEKDPSGRSQCKRCGEKGCLRMGLMMECGKGYRSLCTLHDACFWQHPETKKLVYDELFIRQGVDGIENERIKSGFDSLVKRN